MEEKSLSPSYFCAETGRAFATSTEAHASEERFREIQAACQTGETPELRKGDVIYVETWLYISHGLDDFRGGLAEVHDVGLRTSRGKETPFVETVQNPNHWTNWELLAQQQSKLKGQFGKTWSYAAPDDRAEFNRWDSQD